MVITLVFLLFLNLSGASQVWARQIVDKDMGWLSPPPTHEDAIEPRSHGGSAPDADRAAGTGIDSRSRWVLSYGAPYVAASWTVESGGWCYRRYEYRRAVFLGDRFAYDEFVGTWDTVGGPIWSYGPERLDSAERVEAGNQWFTKKTYSRPAYRYGVFQRYEYVRTTQEAGGPIWTYGPEFLAEEGTVDRENLWYKVETYRRAAYKYGVLQGNELVRVEESPGGPVWSYGPTFVSSEAREERGNTWYIVRYMSRQVFYHGQPHHLEAAGKSELPGGVIWSYSEPRVLSSSVLPLSPPHVELVTEFGRDVFHYGQKVRTEPLPELREVTDACAVDTGELQVSRTYTRQEPGGRDIVVTEFRRPIYHSNQSYGRFVAGYRDEPGATQTALIGAQSGSGASSSGHNVSDSSSTSGSVVKRAARVINSVEEFDDKEDVLASNYLADIKVALGKGIIFGKFNDMTGERPYDPESLITLGEMVNILARNYGGTGLSGYEARDFLVGLGVPVRGNLDGALSLGQLDELARSLANRGAGAADLLVLRQVRDGTLQADAGGITRAHAVAMHHADPAQTASSPQPTATSLGDTPGEPSPAAPVSPITENAPPETTASPGQTDRSGETAVVVPSAPGASSPMPVPGPDGDVAGSDEPLNHPPVALFEVTSPIIAGRSVQYVDRSYDPDNGDWIAEASWTGKVDRFSTPGSFRVSLKVRDSHGAWSELFDRDVLVVPALVVQAEVEPAKSLQGGSVKILATANKAAQRCLAETPWGEVEMAGNGESWSAEILVPETGALGEYDIVVTSYAGDEEAIDTPVLAVVEDPRRSLLITLTD